MEFIIALALALALAPAARLVGLWLGIVDRPVEGALKIHTQPVPVLGGAVAIAAAGVALAAVGEGVRGSILGAAGLALGIGVVDDVRPIPAVVRVVLQIGWALLLLFGWVDMDAVGPMAAFGFVALVLVCVNAVNIADGQDGLAGGLAALAGAGLAGVLAIADEARTFQELGLALSGGLVGFVYWNCSRRRIFLGNGGAYAVGTLLAVLCAAAAAEHGWRGLLGAGVCMGVFGFEIIFTFGRRLLSGSRLLSGDRDHSYDLLSAFTRSRFRTTTLFWAAGAVAAALGMAAAVVPLAVSTALATAFYAVCLLYGLHLLRMRDIGSRVS